MALQLSAETTVYDRYSIANRFIANETAIHVAYGNISLIVSESDITELKNGDKTMYSKLANVQISLDAITTSISSSEYKDINGVLSAVKVNSAKISATPEQIKSVVTSSYVGNLGSITSMESSISQMAGNIELKVNKNGVIASINNSGEAVTINASKINLNGVVTANNNFKILSDGSMQTIKGKIGGWTINDHSIYNVTNGVGAGMQIYGNGPAFWAGDGTLGSSGANATFKVTHDGKLTATKATITGTLTSISGNIKTVLTSGALYLYKNNVQTGRFWSGKWGGTSIIGIGIGASDGAGYMSFGRDDDESNSTLCPFILNWGLNPGGSTEKIIFFSSARFKAGIYSDAAISFGSGYGVMINERYVLSQIADSGINVGNGINTLRLRGTAYANGGTIATTSDANKKNSIQDLDNRYKNLFNNLTPKRFKMNDGTSDRYHVGFIAQDVFSAVNASGICTQDFAGYVEFEDETIETVSYENEIGETEYREVAVKTGGITRALRYEEFIALNTMMIQDTIKEIEEIKLELVQCKNEITYMKRKNQV